MYPAMLNLFFKRLERTLLVVLTAMMALVLVLANLELGYVLIMIS